MKNKFNCSDAECCCRCKHRLVVFGHPWVNGQSVLTPALFVCDHKDQLTLCATHGLCESFEEFQK
jgi:hypothetical protein